LTFIIIEKRHGLLNLYWNGKEFTTDKAAAIPFGNRDGAEAALKLAAATYPEKPIEILECP
jgi:hypothetical protein